MTDTSTTNYTTAPQPDNTIYDEFLAMTPDMLIGFYVQLRDRIQAEDKAHSERMAKPRETLERLNGRMLEILQQAGVSSMKSNAGTVYVTIKTSATLSDKDAFRSYIIENQDFELADIRPAKSAVQDYVVAHDGNLPPGVNYTQVNVVGVRRGKEEA